jgi:hypothetical protein
MHVFLKFCSIAILVLLVIIALPLPNSSPGARLAG